MSYGKVNPSTLNPAQRRKVNQLASEYEKFHWGAPADLVFHVDDPLVPDVTGIGELRDLEIGPSPSTAEGVKLPKGCWLAYDPSNKYERLYIILTDEAREMVRKGMKHLATQPLQEIAEASRGDQADYPLPRIHAAALGTLQAVVYWTFKNGEEGNKAWEYKHQFGEEHSRGIKPILAADVSGRLWVAGGSYRCPAPGITG